MGQLTKQFGKIKVEVEIPHLLNLQVDSYRKFMQEGRTERLPDEGLEGVFRSVFPIEDFNRTASLEFVSYEVGEPKYDQAECISKGLTYESPVRIKVRLVVYDVDDETEARTVRDIKEQDIYFGTLPLMTEKGTFIINGTERVIVNQLQRSPGIIFEHDGGKTHTSRKVLYSCRVIPMRGSWLDFDFDHKDILYVRIDRRRKMPATILLKAMGMSKTDILDCFYKKEVYELEEDGRVSWRFDTELHRKEAAFADIVDKEGNVLVKAGIPYVQTTDLEAVMPELDILYMTRVQRERFFNEEDYLRLKDSYILTPEKLQNARPDLSILHPLPRVNEISVAVDADPRAAYFRQVRYGRFIRMALIMMLLGIQ